MRTQISTLLLGGVVFAAPLSLLTGCQPDIPQATSADVPAASAQQDDVSAAPASDSDDSDAGEFVNESTIIGFQKRPKKTAEERLESVHHDDLGLRIRVQRLAHSSGEQM